LNEIIHGKEHSNAAATHAEAAPSEQSQQPDHERKGLQSTSDQINPKKCQVA